MDIHTLIASSEQQQHRRTSTRSLFLAVACARLVFLVHVLRYVPFVFWQARDARHHGPEGLVRRHPFRGAEADPHRLDYSADHGDPPVAVRFLVVDAPVVQVVLAMPVVVNDMCAGAKNCGVPAVAVHRGRRQFPVVMQRPIPMLLVTMEIPQLQIIDKVIDVCCAGPANPGAAVRRQSRSHSCISNSLDNVVDILVVAQMQITLGSFTTEILQLQYIDKVLNVSVVHVQQCRRGEDSRVPTVALVELRTGCCMPVVCNDRCRVVDDLAHFIDGCGRPVLMLRREL